MVQDCRDPQQAFQNWMERDIGFARYIQRAAAERNLAVLRVDGRQSAEENIHLGARHFGLQPAAHSGSL